MFYITMEKTDSNLKNNNHEEDNSIPKISPSNSNPENKKTDSNPENKNDHEDDDSILKISPSDSNPKNQKTHSDTENNKIVSNPENNSHVDDDSMSKTSPSDLQREKWLGHEFLYKFQGFWFPQIYLQTTQKVLQNYKPSPKDIILASFPKCGTTWLKALLHSITNRNNGNSLLVSNHPQELIPSLETNLFVRHNHPLLGGRRIFGTHIPYQILSDIVHPCKIIYVARNPKDTLVSLWHFLQKSDDLKDEPWELPVAVDQFCDGFVGFGPYHDHVTGYRDANKANPEKVFFVTYEEMKEDPERCVREIGEFLGFPFEEGDGEIERIVNDCSFERLSGLEVNKSNEVPEGFMLPYNSFYRKGEVGDHKNYLDEEMIRRIDGVTVEKFHGKGFMYGV